MAKQGEPLIVGEDNKPLRDNKIYQYLEKFSAVIEGSISKMNRVKGYSLDEVDITVGIKGNAIILKAEGSNTFKYKKLLRRSMRV